MGIWCVYGPAKGSVGAVLCPRGPAALIDTVNENGFSHFGPTLWLAGVEAGGGRHNRIARAAEGQSGSMGVWC